MEPITDTYGDRIELKERDHGHLEVWTAQEDSNGPDGGYYVFDRNQVTRLVNALNRWLDTGEAGD